MAEVDYEVIVVGGGIAGMGAAWSVRDRKVLLLERDQRLGGRLLSYPRGGRWLNLGAHLVPGGDSRMCSLIRDLGLETVAVPGATTALCFKDRVYAPRRPELHPLLLPLPVRDRFAMSIMGLKLMRAVRAWQRAGVRSHEESDTDWRIRLGEYESQRTFADFLGSLPAPISEIFLAAAQRSAGDAQDQVASVGISLFGALWVGRGSGLQLNVRGGSGKIPQAIESRLGDAVALGADAQSVERHRDHVVVAYRDPSGDHHLRAHRVIVATPADAARELVGDLPADVDSALASVRYGPFVCMAIATAPASGRPWDGIYAITTPGMAFNMLFNHANPVAGCNGRDGIGSLMCYAGGGLGTRLLEVDDKEVERLFLTDLARIYPEITGAITETVVKKWRVGNFYRVPNTSLVPLLRYEQQENNAVRFAGDYFAPHGGMMEEAIQSGIRAAAAVRADVDHGER